MEEEYGAGQPTEEVDDGAGAGQPTEEVEEGAGHSAEGIYPALATPARRATAEYFILLIEIV